MEVRVKVLVGLVVAVGAVLILRSLSNPKSNAQQVYPDIKIHGTTSPRGALKYRITVTIVNESPAAIRDAIVELSTSVGWKRTEAWPDQYGRPQENLEEDWSPFPKKYRKLDFGRIKGSGGKGEETLEGYADRTINEDDWVATWRAGWLGKWRFDPAHGLSRWRVRPYGFRRATAKT